MTPHRTPPMRNRLNRRAFLQLAGVSGGAALLAAKILALVDPAVREHIEVLRQKNVDKIIADDTGLGN